MTSLLAEPHVPFGLPIRDAQQPRLLDAVRSACRVRHYSIRTETAYTSWARRFCRFHRGADGIQGPRSLSNSAKR